MGVIFWKRWILLFGGWWPLLASEWFHSATGRCNRLEIHCGELSDEKVKNLFLAAKVSAHRHWPHKMKYIGEDFLKLFQVWSHLTKQKHLWMAAGANQSHLQHKIWLTLSSKVWSSVWAGESSKAVRRCPTPQGSTLQTVSVAVQTAAGDTGASAAC